MYLAKLLTFEIFRIACFILFHTIFFGNKGNVFKGIFDNPIFCSILLITSVLQVLIVQFGGQALHVAEGGLSGNLWALSLILGFVELPMQQLINVLFSLSLNAKSWRQKRRIQRDLTLRTQHQTNVTGHLHQD